MKKRKIIQKLDELSTVLLSEVVPEQMKWADVDYHRGYADGKRDAGVLLRDLVQTTTCSGKAL